MNSAGNIRSVRFVGRMPSTPITAKPKSWPSISATMPFCGFAIIAASKGESIMLSNEHRRRLIERKINPELALRYGVRTAPDGMALLIDYRLAGRRYNTKIRFGKGRMPWEVPGLPLILWNLDSLKDPPAPDEPLIITEGEFDALALLQVGFSRVVSVPNGAP